MLKTLHPRRPARAGFTALEAILVLVVIAAIAAFAIPRMFQGVTREAVRGARTAVMDRMAGARGAAANRACRGVLHVTSGSEASVWVTACAIGTEGIDTVGTPENLSERYGVTVTSTFDSISYTPNGLARMDGWNTLRFSRGDFSDTLAISPVGRAVN